jgi:hypothetical protein
MIIAQWSLSGLLLSNSVPHYEEMAFAGDKIVNANVALLSGSRCHLHCRFLFLISALRPISFLFLICPLYKLVPVPGITLITDVALIADISNKRF